MVVCLQVPVGADTKAKAKEEEAAVKDVTAEKGNEDAAEDATVPVVSPGEGPGCCRSIADELNPDGSRKDPQACWDRARDAPRLLNASKRRDLPLLETLLRRMPSLQARGAREGTMTAGKHQLNMGNTALCRAVSQGEPCLGGTNPKPRP